MASESETIDQLRAQIARMERELADLRADVATCGDPSVGAQQSLRRHERDVSLSLMRLLNDSNNTRELIRSLTAFLQQWSGCEAVGVRLQDGDDFPYYETRGFPPEFVLAENQLCQRDSCGAVVRDSHGNPVLDCMCGNVICGRFNAALPFFTSRGSFWTNCTTELLASTTEADRQARTRNRCNGEGYESVALVALRHRGETFGLLQVNDRARGQFTPDLVAFLEDLADQVAVTLAQRRTQDALRTSERQLHDILEHMLNGFAYCRMLFDGDQPQDFIYLAVNQAFESLTGLRNVVGKKVSQVIPGIRESDPEVLKIYGRVARSGAPEKFEIYVQALKMWFAVSVYGLGEDCFVAVFDVITERKLAEQELIRRERQLAVVYDSVPVVMVLIDQDRRIRRANRAAIDAAGCAEVNGMRGGEALRCLHALDAPQGCGFGSTCAACGIRNMVIDTLGSGASHFREEHPLMIERDGQTLELRLLASAVRLMLEDGPYVLLYIEDITQQRELERQLRQRETELAFLNRLHTVGEMSAALAHEINQPLYAINNYVRAVDRMLQSDAHSARNKRRLSEAIQHASAEVERAAAIVQRMRNFVRGRVPQPAAMNVAGCLQQALELMLPAARDRGVNLTLESQGDVPVIEADPIQIEQVVVNLIVNAMDAVAGLPPQRRSVTIGCRAATDQAVEIVVRDQGCGVPPDLTDKLFEPFVTTKKDGLGVGLAISRSIIESHGGKIRMAPNTMHGSAFFLTLPVAPPQKGPQP